VLEQAEEAAAEEPAPSFVDDAEHVLERAVELVEGDGAAREAKRERRRQRRKARPHGRR